MTRSTKWILASTTAVLMSINALAADDDARDRAVVILDTDSILELRLAERDLLDRGLRIRATLPPSLVVVEGAAGRELELESLPYVAALVHNEAEATQGVAPPSTVESLKLRTAYRLANRAMATTLRSSGDSHLRRAGVMPTIASETGSEHRRSNPPAKSRLRAARLYGEELAKIRSLAEAMSPPRTATGRLDSLFGPRALEFIVSNLPERLFEKSGAAFGAGWRDNCLYLAGHTVVAVFFVPGALGEWVELRDMEAAFERIVVGFDELIDLEPDAGIRFTYILEVDGTGNPLAAPPRNLEYVNELRSRYHSAWSLQLETFNSDSTRASGGYYFPYVQSPRLPSERQVQVAALEAFGARPQWRTWNGANSPTARSGYLGVVNANSADEDGSGFFDGAGEAQPDVMMDTSGDLVLTTYTRGQVGWRDGDGDGVLDPLDTVPRSSLSLVRDGESAQFLGRAEDRPVPHEITTGSWYTWHHAVTLNTIRSVDCRLEDGPWVPAMPVDGAFDTASERFRCDLPELPAGTYHLWSRATNSVGNVERPGRPLQVTIGESYAVNTRPLASLTPHSEKGSLTTVFTFDATASWDLESGRRCLEFAWDLDEDGDWDHELAGQRRVLHRFSTPGQHSIRLRVRDEGDLCAEAVATVRVEAEDLPPRAHLLLSPVTVFRAEDRLVHADARGSRDDVDASSELEIDFDVDGDGVWDEWSRAGQEAWFEFNPNPKSRTTHVMAQARDSSLGSSRVVRSLWGVAYNHRPGIERIEQVAGSGLFIMQEKARHPVIGGGIAEMAWDGDVMALFRITSQPEPSAVVEVFGVSDLTSPKILASYPVPRATGSNVARARLAIDDGFLYVFDWTGRLSIIDVRTPDQAELVGEVQVDPCVSNTQGLAMSGDIAVTLTDTGGLNLVDVSDRSQPAVLGGRPGTEVEVRGLVVSGGLAVAARGRRGLEIWDISDLARPDVTMVYRVDDERSRFTSVGIHGATVAAGDEGLERVELIDISGPDRPRHIGVLTDDSPAVIGLENGIAMVAWNHVRDLVLMDVRNPVQPRLVGLHELLRLAHARLEDGRLRGLDLERLELVELEIEETLLVEAIGAHDANRDEIWDGVLEFRWDLDGDGAWETSYDERYVTMAVPALPGLDGVQRIVCEVRDRYGATAQASYEWRHELPPEDPGEHGRQDACMWTSSMPIVP